MTLTMLTGCGGSNNNSATENTTDQEMDRDGDGILDDAGDAIGDGVDAVGEGIEDFTDSMSDDEKNDTVNNENSDTTK